MRDLWFAFLAWTHWGPPSDSKRRVREAFRTVQLYIYYISGMNMCCMLCHLRTHNAILQTIYTDIHSEATCSSVAFTKFALLSPRVFAFVPDRNNLYGECLCMRASASTLEFHIAHISLPGLASSLEFVHGQGWQAHCNVMAHVISKRLYSAGTGWQARVIKYTDVIYSKHNT